MNYGVVGQATGSGKFNYGGDFLASSALAQNIGITSVAYTSNPQIPYNTAGKFDAYDAQFNYGVYSMAEIRYHNTGTQTNYAGFFDAAAPGMVAYPGNTNIGIYVHSFSPTSPGTNLSAIFDGTINLFGEAYATGIWHDLSDSIAKENILPIDNALISINNLKPYSFNFKVNEYSYLNLPDGKQFGLVAQEVEPFLPELVSEMVVPAKRDSTGNMIRDEQRFKALNYNGFIPILIQGVKELDSIVTGITSPPSKPVLLSPSNEAVDVSPSATFFWQKQNNVNYYRIIFSTTPDSSGINQIYDVTDTMATGAFECGVTYYWWVIAYNTYGHSEASDIWSFTTAFPPSAPDLASPANGDTITENNIILSWHPAEGASVYAVNIQAIPGAHQQAIPIYPLQFVTDTFLYFEVNPFLNYSWSVSACIEARVCCSSSETWHFSTMEGFDIIKAQSVSELSDSQLKTNVAPLTGSLSNIEQLNGISFEWDSLQYPGAVFEQGKQIGLIAQDVQPVIPEVVKTDAQGYSYIEYNRLIPVLIESIKEQQSTIDSMKLQIQSLLGTNQKSTGNNENSENQSKMQYVELASENAIILNQNDPNPFAEETDITYYIPDNVSEAKLIFYDNSGKIIKTVELISKGNGALHVYASNLSSGIYTYALVADGKVIDTKKMVCTKK